MECKAAGRWEASTLSLLQRRCNEAAWHAALRCGERCRGTARSRGAAAGAPQRRLPWPQPPQGSFWGTGWPGRARRPASAACHSRPAGGAWARQQTGAPRPPQAAAPGRRRPCKGGSQEGWWHHGRVGTSSGAADGAAWRLEHSCGSSDPSTPHPPTHPPHGGGNAGGQRRACRAASLPRQPLARRGHGACWERRGLGSGGVNGGTRGSCTGAFKPWLCVCSTGNNGGGQQGAVLLTGALAVRELARGRQARRLQGGRRQGWRDKHSPAELTGQHAAHDAGRACPSMQVSAASAGSCPGAPPAALQLTPATMRQCLQRQARRTCSPSPGAGPLAAAPPSGCAPASSAPSNSGLVLIRLMPRGVRAAGRWPNGAEEGLYACSPSRRRSSGGTAVAAIGGRAGV